MKVLFNGELVSIEQTPFDDNGWLEGNGLFETIKTVDSKPWALSRHMRRVINGALELNIKLPSEEKLLKAISELLETEEHQEGALRLFFDTNGAWGGIHRAYEKNREPARVITYPKNIEGMRKKIYPYQHRLQILNELKAVGMDEGIVINTAGRVAEGSVTNLLFKIEGKWCTPPISDGALPGIVRALVIENFEVTVRSILKQEIESIESAFLLSSLRIAQPIKSIDARLLSQSPQFQAEIEAMAVRTSVG